MILYVSRLASRVDAYLDFVVRHADRTLPGVRAPLCDMQLGTVEVRVDALGWKSTPRGGSRRYGWKSTPRSGSRRYGMEVAVPDSEIAVSGMEVVVTGWTSTSSFRWLMASIFWRLVTPLTARSIVVDYNSLRLK